ncbi:UDP-N-acetylglucosamine--dolichyl-phosphate N-acetylglucosaminephosphotransferase [Leptidea sinapis]|uniref:UDP-N-acetylglucosamine--dolichyl-phosphate N-acetylglucosaminephosphotransferase n=1 Tax=Leptidea sinapis TaxID=189913 RepID=UPI002124D798|nr:UDP-N-acetylglucosamine--dolichyl-phosphate N-acetylglucosaminephosphotransferase [Leptidea sinapis]
MDFIYLHTMWILIILTFISSVAYFITDELIPKLKELFIKAGLYGIDLCKTSKDKVPEALGVVSGCTFLVTSFLFIPIVFGNNLMDVKSFPHSEFAELLAALLSICCMLLLGFADDVLDLRWRYKLLLPTIASLPLLVVYYVNFNSTTIIVPIPLRQILGTTINIGFVYYIYMGMLAVFCTNAINILAGINGLEVGQSVIIASSVIIFNILELGGDQSKAHTFSLYVMIPYLFTTLPLLKHNWYPSKVFVGDTFCYVSGMTFAVVAILGHFSKTVLLFFIPQIFNFIYSVPQLFHIIPCPRHRLPKYCAETDLLQTSVTVLSKKDQDNLLTKFVLKVFKLLAIVNINENNECIYMNNLTIINLFLVKLGPTSEVSLTKRLLCLQIICSCFAFLIRYPLASYFYNISL